MTQQAVLDIQKDSVFKFVLNQLKDKNYLETKYPLLNRGPIISCIQHNVNLQWVLDYKELIGVDAKELQRYLQEWTLDEQQEFITNILYGYELKDTFQLIVLDEQILWLEKQINSVVSDKKKKQYKKELKYFKYWKYEKKKTFLCIDGQHRLYYLYLLLTGELLINIKEPEKGEWSYNNESIELNDTLFTKHSEEIQKVIKSIEIACIFWSNAPLSKFKFIFTSCNKGKSPHHHELRSVFNKGDWGIFCSETLLDCPDRDQIWDDIMKLSAKITFAQKADTYYLSSLFPFWYKELGHKTLPLVDKYDFIKTDFLYATDYNIPNNILKEYYKDIQFVYTIIKSLNPKTFTVCQFTNLLYYYIKFTKSGIGPDSQTYNIRKPLEFINQFLTDETDRYERDKYVLDADNKVVIDGNGDEVEKEHRYESKNSTNTYKNVVYRKKMMNEDIHKNVNHFAKNGIIQKQGNRSTGLTAEKVAYNNDYKDRSGKPLDMLDLRSKDSSDSYVVNEENPTSQGGDRTLDNANLMKQKPNLRLYNSEQKYNEQK